MKAYPRYHDGTIPYNVQRRYLPGKPERIWELDFLRGICVILMILDHMAMLVDYFGYSWYDTLNWYAAGMGNGFVRLCHWWTYNDNWRLVHNIVLFVFFSISGISCTFSRSNLHRGAQLGLIAELYSLATLFAEYVIGLSGQRVLFGVLNFLAAVMLIYAALEWLCRGDSRSISVCCAGLIGITLILYFCYTPPATTPKFLAFVFPIRNFYGERNLFYSQAEISPGDMFTLIPYSAYFFFGAMIGPFLYGNRRSLLPRLDKKWHRPVSFVGRHALIVYLAHLVLMAGILALITGLFITPGEFGI